MADSDAPDCWWWISQAPATPLVGQEPPPADEYFFGRARSLCVRGRISQRIRTWEFGECQHVRAALQAIADSAGVDGTRYLKPGFSGNAWVVEYAGVWVWYFRKGHTWIVFSVRLGRSERTWLREGACITGPARTLFLTLEAVSGIWAMTELEAAYAVNALKRFADDERLVGHPISETCGVRWRVRIGDVAITYFAKSEPSVVVDVSLCRRGESDESDDGDDGDEALPPIDPPAIHYGRALPDLTMR